MIQDIVVTIPGWILATFAVCSFLISAFFACIGAVLIWAVFQVENK